VASQVVNQMLESFRWARHFRLITKIIICMGFAIVLPQGVWGSSRVLGGHACYLCPCDRAGTGNTQWLLLSTWILFCRGTKLCPLLFVHARPWLYWLHLWNKLLFNWLIGSSSSTIFQKIWRLPLTLLMSLNPLQLISAALGLIVMGCEVEALSGWVIRCWCHACVPPISLGHHMCVIEVLELCAPHIRPA
jgi:hypothetical protein